MGTPGMAELSAEVGLSADLSGAHGPGQETGRDEEARGMDELISNNLGGSPLY